jgi:hypothetical protein
MTPPARTSVEDGFRRAPVPGALRIDEAGARMAVHVLHHSGVLVVTVFEGSDPSSLRHLGDVLDVVSDVQPLVVDVSELTLGSIERITVLIALLNALAAPAGRRTWVVAPRPATRRLLLRLGVAEAVRMAPSIESAIAEAAGGQVLTTPA